MDKTIKVAVLGAGFIGQMHSTALHAIPVTQNDPPLRVELTALADKNENQVKVIGERFGYQRIYTDWREMLEKEKVDLFVNAAPNFLHGSASVEAAKRGIHVLCEKPLAATSKEAYEIWKSVSQYPVIHMCAYMWRAIPAIRLIREMIQAGELGEIMNFRSKFLLNMLQEDGNLSWRFSRKEAGTGAIGDMGSHHIDVARFTCGEVRRVSSISKTWSKDASGKITDVNDDAFACVAELENGAIATFESSRVTPGHNLTGKIEIDGTKGSVKFSMERLNELEILQPGKGVLNMMINKKNHPSSNLYLPVGVQGAHPHGWNDCFTMQDTVMVNAICHGREIKPWGADMEDAYKVEEIVDAIERSNETERFEEVKFKK